ncbi:hypothetical protein D4764_06G0007900 [Takifugu flavidus]|uniref:Alkylated DNA repair protein AlkB homologue 8 N-terminal domain-containing protein n=1 Tax=Takifugu flavidus TaxID=433684 RepID=A0A5C6N0K9_9TELE|nr:hypothetical protein D4764_06G0007900 [Takifugu flavidus]
MPIPPTNTSLLQAGPEEEQARKLMCPDGISSRLLKFCADQLYWIFSHTFNLSLKLGRVSQLWKTSCIVPVPKTPHPKELNSYRPVALTFHLMKTLGWITTSQHGFWTTSHKDHNFSYNSSSCHLQKFSDDSAAVSLITAEDDTERNNYPPPAALNILGTDVNVVKTYKYLGVHLNNNLDWTHNTDTLVKKGNSRLFLLRRLRSFGVQGPLLRTFYESVVGSAIFYVIVCWSSSIMDRDRRRMDRLVRRASSVLGCPLDSVEVWETGG